MRIAFHRSELWQHGGKAFSTNFGTAGSAVVPMTARAYSRICGANDRFQIGQIGCGQRGLAIAGC